MPTERTRAAMVRRVGLPLSAAIMTANVAGAAVVFAFLAWVLPLPDVPDRLGARASSVREMAAQLARAAVVRRVAVPLAAAIMTANIVGAAVVFVFLAWCCRCPTCPTT